MIQAFAAVPSERRWVKLSERALADVDKVIPDPARYQAGREALTQARGHRDAGRMEQAEAIWRGLEELYRDDDGARDHKPDNRP